MKKKMRRLLSGIVAATMMTSLLLGSVAAAAASDETTDIQTEVTTDAGTDVAVGTDVNDESEAANPQTGEQGTAESEAANPQTGEQGTAESVAAETETTEPEVLEGFPFTDVTEGQWFYSYVKSVYENGYMTGLDETTFGPTKLLSRGQFVTILYRMENLPEVQFDAKYGDVQDGMFYSAPVMWASANGIVTGYDNGNFGPADSITREQMAVMMFRYAAFKGYDTTSISNDLGVFPDKARTSSFASVQMQWAVAFGMISGSQGNLVPQGDANRAECATIITRFMNQFQPDHEHNYELTETVEATSFSAKVEKETCTICECTHVKSVGDAVPVTMEVKDINENQGTFTVEMTGVSAPYAFHKVQVPIWCSADQSDIVWYDAADQGNGNYTVHVNIADHGYHSGKYKADAYLVLNTGEKVFLKSARADVTPVNLIYTVDAGLRQKTVAIINPTVDGQAAEKVEFATWSEQGGQDDINWYAGYNNGNGVWTATIDSANHKHSGTYETHVYGTVNSKQTYLGKTSYELSRAGSAQQREVEALAAEVIDEVTTSDMTAQEKLYACYMWSVETLEFDTYDTEPADGYTPSQYYAIFGFENLYGDCYVFAATFKEMAAYLGYDAHLVDGYVATNSDPAIHGWVEIDMDGTTYVFDPEFEYAEGLNGFQFTYGASNTYQYMDYYRWD